MLKGDLDEKIDYKLVREILVYPKNPNLQDEIKKKIIFVFVSKFVSKIYGVCMINAWLSKKKGCTFFDMMTMSDFAYTVAVLENSYEVWDQEIKKENMTSTEWETYMKSEDYIEKTPKYTDRKGKKREYCGSGWSKAGIEFFNDVRTRWREISSRNMVNAWSNLEKDWAEYAEENNFGNMYTRKVTSKDTSSDSPHDDNEGEGQDRGLPADRFDLENEDCPWKNRYNKNDDVSDLDSEDSCTSRPQKRSRMIYSSVSHPGRVSLESDDKARLDKAAQRAQDDFDEESHTEGGSFGSDLMVGV